MYEDNRLAAAELPCEMYNDKQTHLNRFIIFLLVFPFLLGFIQGTAEKCNSFLWQRIFPLQTLQLGVKFLYTWQQRVNFVRFWIRSLRLILCFYIYIFFFSVARRRRYFKTWRMPPEPWIYAEPQSSSVWSRVIKKDMAHALLFQSTSYQKRWLIYFFATARNWLLRHKIPTVKFCQKIDWEILSSTLTVWRTEPSFVGYMRMLV
jgi:hypothetical protein